jgi:hypothetical protein
MSQSFNYYILRPADGTHFCGVDDDAPGLRPVMWMIRKGRRLSDRYPEDVVFRMGKSYRGIAVGDLIQNERGYCMASAKLKEIFEREAGVELEFLRFRLLNHKGRKASDECYIVNVIGTQDCADMARSEGQVSLSEPGTFLRLKKLYLDEAKIDPAARVFRVQQKPYLVIIREDFRALLESEDITGARYIPIGEPVSL